VKRQIGRRRRRYGQRTDGDDEQPAGARFQDLDSGGERRDALAKRRDIVRPACRAVGDPLRRGKKFARKLEKACKDVARQRLLSCC